MTNQLTTNAALPRGQAAAFRLLEELARATFGRLKSAKELEISQGEETITDIILLEMARLKPLGMRVIKVTKSEESIRGIDWDWWIRRPDGQWAHLAVQAKKLSPDAGVYGSLGHKVRGIRQVELLEHYAKNYPQQPAVPVYCLYNFRFGLGQNIAWHCRLPRDETQLGCTITPLPNVVNALKKRGGRTFDALNVHIDTVPWRCVLCPSPGSGCPTFTYPLFMKDEVFSRKGLPEKIASAIGNDLAIVADDGFPRLVFDGGSKIVVPQAVVVSDLGSEG